MNRLDIDWSDLKELYTNQGISAKRLGKIKHCDGATIAVHLKLMGIPIHENYNRRLKLDWSDLEKLYLTDHLSAVEIGRMKGCNGGTVIYYLKRRKIAMRTANEQQRIYFAKTPHDHYHTWKGGIYRLNGYIYHRMPSHPNAISHHGYVAEHRLVVEKRLGRFLLSTEHVHHINGIRDDNRDENLEVLNRSNHSLRTQFCQECELKKEIRLLKWQVKELNKGLQMKLKEEA